MTTVLKLRIGQGRADLTLACGHVTRLVGYSVMPIPRPGTEPDCPACRELETDLAAQFTAAQVERLKFMRWLRQNGRVAS